MKKLIYLIILSLFQFAFKTDTSVSVWKIDDDWHLEKNEKGISVYTRKTSNSDFKEIKSIANVKASLRSIVALIYDWDNYPQWVYKCGQSISLKKLNDTTVVHYQTILSPWPAEKRDLIEIVEVSQDKETGIVTIKSVCISDYIPRIAHYLRVTDFKASWTLIPKKNGEIQIIYQLIANPGGNIPAWLVNMAAVDGPFETMANLKDQIVKKKYKEAKISFIKELN